VVGGVFALEPPADTPSPPVLLAAGPLMLASGRAALAVALAGLAPRRVWLPAYVCESVLDGVGPGPELRFYPVGESLTASDVEGASPGDVVILVDYFGWPSPPGLVASLRAAGAVVVEDACQALLSAGVGIEADAWIASPRKFVGVPDGGLLWPVPEGATAEAGPPPGNWWVQALEACVARRAFDQGGGDRAWFATFREAEAGVPTAPHAMSELTRVVLSHAIDARAIAAQRRSNYECLYAELADLSLMGSLPDEVVPLGFPICVSDRDRIRSALFERNVFPPVHWPVPDAVPREFVAERRLAARVMTLPCDQRYDEDDMMRVAQMVRAEA
jgi:hypothetical protein